MRLIVVGSEYTGKTTFVRDLKNWIIDTMGDKVVMIHDHFLPHVGEGAAGCYSTEDEEGEFFSLKPFALEKYMRYMIHYHLGSHFYLENDHLLVNWYYGDAVYAPMYFGYGGRNAYGDRMRMARGHDHEVMSIAPDTILLHLTASAEVIRERMRSEPRPNSRVREQDVEVILERFEEEFASSLIRRKIALDTGSSSPKETLQAFLSQMHTFWTPQDRLRLINHYTMQEAFDRKV